MNTFDYNPYSTFESMFFLIFFFIFGLMIFQFIKGLITWNKNNHSPRLVVQATVISKRISITYCHHSDNHMQSHSSTSYYLTFEVESGDRIEFLVDEKEYGLLVEGDVGKLKFQGSRYLSFERER